MQWDYLVTKQTLGTSMLLFELCYSYRVAVYNLIRLIFDND